MKPATVTAVEPTPRSNKFTPAQDRAIRQYLDEQGRTYAWLLDVALRQYFATQGIEFPDKYGMRRAA